VRAAIDVGTNTTRLLVARVEHGRVAPIAQGSSMTALGEGLERTGVIGLSGLDAVREVAAAMAEEARTLGAQSLVVACTAVARDARNAEALLTVLEQATGVRPRVLSGDEEALLTFRGLVGSGAPDPLLAADLGGGSLELMGGTGGELGWSASLPLGVRRVTERYRPADPPQLDLLGPMVSYARSLIDPVARHHDADGALVAGGSAVALGRLAGTDRLDRQALVEAVERLAAAPAEDVAAETGLEPARVRMCFAGAGVLEAVRRAFALDALTVSHAGLREGLVLEQLA
jgi:exopolyphosphatase / guanosine-5'-triphosphate,3'-diphosphate pyrophosphatase